ncbi:WAP four-disulfide core domain protein 2-like [Littorina saxatilis]|uniref:WAP four-disulfide core domain protein 2-like n=1 Tax=Littorina saxatilis TaxID=31220 RepID=UPI0038B4389A
MYTTRTLFFAWMILCLHHLTNEARSRSRRRCGVRCPEGRVCVRFPTNFHICVPLPTMNTTAGIESVLMGVGEDGPVVEERGGSTCPPPPSSPPENCVTSCRTDNDCRSNEACCSTGCGYKCFSRRPETVNKPGFCRADSSTFSEACGSLCRNDYECTGDNKCCLTQCGMTCQAPCYHWRRNQRLNPWRLSQRCSNPDSAMRRSAFDVEPQFWGL